MGGLEGIVIDVKSDDSGAMADHDVEGLTGTVKTEPPE